MTSARDLVVTVPQRLWLQWIAEGDLPGDPPEESGTWDFYIGSHAQAQPGARVYVVAFGRLRGYAPLLRVEGRDDARGGSSLVRGGGAVACTISRPIEGFRGHRYRDWDRSEEQAFPDWATAGLPPKLAAEVRDLLAARARGPEVRAALRRWALGQVG